MKRGILSAPDAFSSTPLLALLPVRGDISKLELYSSALFARYDQVALQRASCHESGDADKEIRYAIEEGMLRQVLDWLAIKPE